MTEKLTEFTINREEWVRGGEDAALLLSDGRMCCLGIAAKACGLSDDVLLDVGEPVEIIHDGHTKESKIYFEKLPFLGKVIPNEEAIEEYCANENMGYWNQWGEFYGVTDEVLAEIPQSDLDNLMTVEQSDDCTSLMGINDDSGITEEEREAKIADIFARNGVKVTFVG